MRVLRALGFRIGWLINRSKGEADLNAELQDYIENQTEKYIMSGLSPEKARLATLHDVGGIELIKEECRDARGAAWLDETLRDINYALRSFRRSLGFVSTIAGTIALGLGLNTALFTIFNAYVLRPISVHDPYALYSLSWTNRAGQEHGVSWPDYENLRKVDPAFSDVAAIESLYTHLEDHPVQGQLVTGNYFHLLGVGAALGRTLLPEDAAAPSRDPVLVISYATWQRLFVSRPDIIGRKVSVRGYPMKIVGVVQPQFRGLAEAPQDFWAPLTMSGRLQDGPDLFGADHPEQLIVLGRIKSNLSLASVQAALNVWSHQATSQLPENLRATGVILRSKATAIPLTPELSLLFSPLLTAFGLVLLLACTNVANMMLARAMGRQREIGIRLSLGAVRARLIRQLFTESILLAVPAAILGLALSQIITKLAIHAMLASLPQDMLEQIRTVSFPVDWRVFGFIAVASLISALLFGLAPALQATRGDLMLAARGEFSSDLGPMRLRNFLVVAQTAACTLLLIACGVLVRTTLSMSKVNIGFRTHGVIALKVLEKDRAHVLTALRTDADVDAIVAASSVPLGGPVPNTTVSGQNGSAVNSAYNYVSPNYFDILHIPILRGRNFTPNEAVSGMPVTILSSATTHKLFPNTDPLGKLVELKGTPGKPAERAQVIGVAGDIITCCIPYGKDVALLYLPTLPLAAQRSLLVRVHGDVELNKRRLEAKLRELTPGAVDDIHSLDQYRAAGLYPFRAASFIGFAVASVALLLTVSGIYGVLSYLVSQRTKEIGIRVALGATTNGVTRLILKQSLRLAAIGLSFGLPVALILSYLLASEMLFFRVFDVWVFGAGSLLVLSASLLAGYVPSRRAARIDPIRTLRYD